jgi:chemotaxis methyl-accepting protein methylase
MKNDLLGFSDDAGFDLILCRNVGIFLCQAGSTNLWTRLTGQLLREGLLVTGKAERPPANLPLERVGACVYRKT